MKTNSVAKSPQSGTSAAAPEKPDSAFSQPKKTTPLKKPGASSTPSKISNQKVAPKVVRPKRDCFDDMLVIPPILDEITIKKKLQQLKADYFRKNAVVIRKKLLLAALNKGMRYRGGPESQTHRTEIRSTKRTPLDIQQEKGFKEFEQARSELLQDLTPGQSP